MTTFAHQGSQARLLYRLARYLHSGQQTWLKKRLLAVYPAASRINDILDRLTRAPRDQRRLITTGRYVPMPPRLSPDLLARGGAPG